MSDDSFEPIQCQSEGCKEVLLEVEDFGPEHFINRVLFCEWCRKPLEMLLLEESSKKLAPRIYHLKCQGDCESFSLFVYPFGISCFKCHTRHVISPDWPHYRVEVSNYK